MAVGGDLMLGRLNERKNESDAGERVPARVGVADCWFLHGDRCLLRA